MFSIGTWSRQWLQREVSEEEADPALLMWDMQRNLRLDRLPQERLVTLFRFRDAPDKKRAWWRVAERAGTDLCLSDPGLGTDLKIRRGGARAMAEVWIGKLGLGAAMRSRRLSVQGPEHLVRSLPEWLGLNVFAYPDPRPSSPPATRRAGDRRLRIGKTSAPAAFWQDGARTP